MSLALPRPSTLRQRAEVLPRSCGVYLFKGAADQVLYVGKAADLRARVRQYLLGHDEREMVPWLVAEARDLEVVLTRDEAEALRLESNLIRRHRPPYNAQIPFEARPAWLRIDLSSSWPTWSLVRAEQADGARYIGPMHNSLQAYGTLEFIQRSFPLRTCSDQELQARRRPCMLHQMGRCLAPCDPDEGLHDRYQEQVQDSVTLAIRGEEALLERVTQRMHRAAEALAFEEAGRLRDLAQALQRAADRAPPRGLAGDRDAWGLFLEGDRGLAAVLPTRDGRLLAPQYMELPANQQPLPQRLAQAMLGWYAPGTELPPELLVPVLPHDEAALRATLKRRRRGPLMLKAPKRGERAKLVTLARRNARERFRRSNDPAPRQRTAMQELGELLDLRVTPARVQLLMAGPGRRDPVLGMARPSPTGADRWEPARSPGTAAHRELRVAQRLLQRAARDDAGATLWWVQHPATARELTLAALALGLREHRVLMVAHGPGGPRIQLPQAPPLELPSSSAGAHLLAEMQEQAELSLRRRDRGQTSRRKQLQRLQDVPGVGARNARALLRQFGSLRAMRESPPDALLRVQGVGPARAAAVRAMLQQLPT